MKGLLDPGAGIAGARHTLDVGALGLHGLLLQERDRLLINVLGARHPAVVKRRNTNLGYLVARNGDGDRQNPEVVIDGRTGDGPGPVDGPGPGWLRGRRGTSLGRRTPAAGAAARPRRAPGGSGRGLRCRLSASQSAGARAVTGR